MTEEEKLKGKTNKDRHADRQTDRQTDRHTDRHTASQTAKQTDNNWNFINMSRLVNNYTQTDGHHCTCSAVTFTGPQGETL